MLPADLADGAEVAALAERAGAVDVLIANAALPASGAHPRLQPGGDRPRARRQPARADPARARAGAGDDRAWARPARLRLLAVGQDRLGRAPAIYSATKFGLRGFAAGLRADLHGTGVGVTAVFPGFVSDAGLFADSGAKLPPGMGTRTPAQVADAIVGGVERDRGEVDVAPLGLRLAALAWSAAPTGVATLQRRLGTNRVADAIADGQRSKR